MSAFTVTAGVTLAGASVTVISKTVASKTAASEGYYRAKIMLDGHATSISRSGL